MTRIVPALLFLVLCLVMKGQHISPAPVLNGVISPGEYGSGATQETSAAITWYCNWDNNRIYFAISGANVTEGAIIYMDVNPTIPVNGGGNGLGSVTWPTSDYDQTRFHYPIRSDIVIYVKSTYSEYRYADGSGSWGGIEGTVSGVFANAGNQVIEFSMFWDDVTNGNGRPAAFNWFGYKLYTNGVGNNGMYGPVPQNNPTTPMNAGFGAVNEVYPVYYYSVVNTDNGTATAPFAARSFTYHQDNSAAGTGGYVLNGNQSFFDFTINDNSLNNNDNVGAFYDNNDISNRVLIGGNLNVTRNLVVWTGSALLPADNSSGPVLSTVTLSGSNSRIYNEGRIDSNPEIGGTDYNFRRLSWVIDGNVTYEASSLFKEFARFSDLIITNSASFHGPVSGTAQFELQYGTLTNNGELDFSGSSGGTLDIGTRGDVTSPNTYFFSNPTGQGTFIFNDILIGRNSSTLAAAPSGGLIQLNVKGNFENYGDFQPSNLGSSISVKMNGDQRQEIRGNSTETVGNRTTFHSLIIDNDNLLNNSNALADVHFVSYGGDEVDYLITDTLSLISGDLVTRDRITSTIVHDLVVDSGATVIHAAAMSDMPSGEPSSFVDGPLSRVNSSILDEMVFPIGKENSLRRVTLLSSQSVYARDTIMVEMFQESADFFGYPVIQTPEAIFNISQVRWWEIQNPGADAMDSFVVTLEYDVNGVDDGVVDPDGLRVLKASSSQWENIGSTDGGTGIGTGEISSFPYTGYGAFTFGNTTTNPLPVELLSFNVSKHENGALCRWSTATELNNAMFLIDHSTDGWAYQQIHRETGQGDASHISNYEYFHSEPPSGWNYYRLTQVDFSGEQEELGIEAIWFDRDAEVHVFPNPVTDLLSIQAKKDQFWTIKLYDATGRLVKSHISYGTLVEMQMSSVLPGVYHLQIENLVENQWVQIIKD